MNTPQKVIKNKVGLLMCCSAPRHEMGTVSVKS